MIDAIVVAEVADGGGPNWATLSASDVANVVIAFGVPLVALVGVVIAWLWKGVGEGIGGTMLLFASLVALVSSLAGLGGGGVSMAASALPIALIGMGFLYCWWRMRQTHAQ
jgi:hypothetical protein